MDIALILLLIALLAVMFIVMPIWPWSVGWGWVPCVIPAAWAAVVAAALIWEGRA